MTSENNALPSALIEWYEKALRDSSDKLTIAMKALNEIATLPSRGIIPIPPWSAVEQTAFSCGVRRGLNTNAYIAIDAIREVSAFVPTAKTGLED